MDLLIALGKKNNFVLLKHNVTQRNIYIPA